MTAGNRLWELCLLEAKARKTAIFKVRAVRSVTFIGSKGAFVSSFNTMERFHIGKILDLLGQSL